jgi:hypothetical protein
LFFGLTVNLAGRQLLLEIVLYCGNELALHQVQDLHRSHDARDQPMDLQRRRLMARRLANHHLLDQVPHDWHQARCFASSSLLLRAWKMR